MNEDLIELIKALLIQDPIERATILRRIEEKDQEKRNILSIMSTPSMNSEETPLIQDEENLKEEEEEEEEEGMVSFIKYFYSLTLYIF